MTYVAAKTAIASVIAGVSGIHQAPTNPNETQNDFPVAIIYLQRGKLSTGPTGTRKSLYNINIDVMTPMLDINNDLAILDPFIDSVTAALLAEISGNGDKLSGTISTFDDVDINYVAYSYAGVPCRGYRFTMNNVKILSNT